MANKRELLTQEMIIEALRTSGGIVAVAAQKIGVARQTLHVWIAEEIELRTAINETREVTLDLAEAAMLKLIGDGDREAIKYYLNCFGKARGWVQTSRAEVDSTIRFEASDNAREIIAGKLAQLAARNGASSDPGGAYEQAGEQAPLGLDVLGSP
jgi:Bacterial regulatory protein, Fis family